MLLDDQSNVDLDDMFGVRRALEALPESLRDGFLDQWRALTESKNNNLAAIRTVAARNAEYQAIRDGDQDPVAAAWRIVNEAMTRYLAWNADG